jgi:hypothetical protein
MKFLARGRQCECEAFSTNVTQLCVTAEVAKGVVFFDKIGAGAPVIKRVVFRWWDLRRLYSAKTNLSSLFFSFGAFSLIRAGLLRRSK